MDDDDWDMTEDEYDEPSDTCARCGGDVYEDDLHVIDGAPYCDQCAWWILKA